MRRQSNNITASEYTRSFGIFPILCYPDDGCGSIII